ncbi:hypothetical protein V2J09_017028 [Rumex salicifolius]
MATLTMSMAPWISGGGGIRTLRPSPPMALLSGSSVRTTGISLRSSTSRPALLSCSFIPLSSSLSSSFAGLSLGLSLSSSFGVGNDRCRRLIVRAGKRFQLCQTKRNRSRKSLARTHGFRRRMRTTSGRALLKRRRDKGRKILCPKSNPSSGKHGEE